MWQDWDQRLIVELSICYSHFIDNLLISTTNISLILINSP